MNAVLRNLAYGVGLVAVLAATAAAQTLPWKEKYDDSTGEGGPTVVAGLGRPVRLHDMEWRFGGITEGKPQKSFSPPLPPRTRVAVVVFSVKPLTPAASQWFTGASGDCSIQVTDRRNRVWSPSTRSDLAPPGGNEAGCKADDANFKPKPLAVGQERKIQKEFVVPQDAFSALQVQIRLAMRPGTVRMSPQPR
ncbi:hypothetical protein [Streptosporangium sp. NPDC000396]|uniref:hypothetical protein n=1 Tax=Streptosporangium sp. NPDC000396 TaxID=3366185 RepID=UPI00369D9D2B